MKRDTTPSGAVWSSRREPPAGGSRLALVHPQRWAHTLILTGELDGRSATALEEEIESLCREGVAVLRLDLRQLRSIDELGLAVIAFRSRECNRQGCTVEVLAETALTRRTLSEAGVTLAIQEQLVSVPDAIGGC